MADKEQLNKFLSKQNREKMQYMKNPVTIKKFINIFNQLCRKCKQEVWKHPEQVTIDKLCKVCRRRAERELK